MRRLERPFSTKKPNPRNLEGLGKKSSINLLGHAQHCPVYSYQISSLQFFPFTFDHWWLMDQSGILAGIFLQEIKQLSAVSFWAKWHYLDRFPMKSHRTQMHCAAKSICRHLVFCSSSACQSSWWVHFKWGSQWPPVKKLKSRVTTLYSRGNCFWGERKKTSHCKCSIITNIYSSQIK